MRFRRFDLPLFFAGVILLLSFAPVSIGQRIAVLTPDENPQSSSFAGYLADALEGKLRLVDSGAADAAFRSIKVESAFNLTSDQAKSIGTVIGSDFFVIVSAVTQRRTSSARPTYYEAYSAIYLVNSRTGLLDHWYLETKNGDTAAEAEKLLNDSITNIADTISAKVKNSKLLTDPVPEFEMFDPDSKTMRPAMPYRRIKPEYTPAAYLYSIAATIDAEVSIDTNGEIKRIDITRWAGYGLDESVIAAIRQMNWRPGERAGKPLPMRVLLRYNFTKIEKN